MLNANPCDAVDPPTPTRLEMSWADAEQTAALLTTVAGTRFHGPILVAVTTGLRRGELLALRWADVDLDKRTLSVVRTVDEIQGPGGSIRFKEPKSQKSRHLVTLASVTVDALRRQRVEQAARRLLFGLDYVDNGLVIDGAGGRVWSPAAFTDSYRRMAKRNGIGLRFHDLRRSHATRLLLQGVHPQNVSERLGTPPLRRRWIRTRTFCQRYKMKRQQKLMLVCAPLWSSFRNSVPNSHI